MFESSIAVTKCDSCVLRRILADESFLATKLPGLDATRFAQVQGESKRCRCEYSAACEAMVRGEENGDLPALEP